MKLKMKTLDELTKEAYTELILFDMECWSPLWDVQSNKKADKPPTGE